MAENSTPENGTPENDTPEKSTPDLDPNDPEVRLTRFLYLGKEYPDYQPGCWFSHKYFTAKNVPSIEELAANPDTQYIPIQTIMTASQSKLVPHPETLIFALAVCCRQTKSEALRRVAYIDMETLCNTPDRFLLFVKFATDLSKQGELDGSNGPKSGWGLGMRKTVNDWYLTKDPLGLAKCVTWYKGRYGWKHKDIIKLSHAHTNDPEKALVLKYTIHGLQDAEKAYEGNDSCAYLLEYIKEVESFKRCTDEHEALDLIKKYKFSLEHVPVHLLKSETIWKALIPSMDLNMLLNNLQRIHNLEFLKPFSPMVSTIVQKLDDEETIVSDNVQPALILITVRNYEHSGQPIAHEKRKMKERAKKPAIVPQEPNRRIIRQLYKTLNFSFGTLKPTGLRYMVTISTNESMMENRAWHGGNVSGLQAACLIALSLLRSEKIVTVATFLHVGLYNMNLYKKETFQKALFQLQMVPGGNSNLRKPIITAARENKRYDVFINIVDQICEKSDKSAEALDVYRTKFKLPNVKLINCAVCSSSVYVRQKWDKNILTISGFDATVPNVIRAFVTSQF